MPNVFADQNDVTFYANLTGTDPSLNNHPGPIEAARALDAASAGTSVYLFLRGRDATPDSTGGSVGNYNATRATSSNRIDGKYIDTSQPIFSSTSMPTTIRS